MVRRFAWKAAIRNTDRRRANKCSTRLSAGPAGRIPLRTSQTSLGTKARTWRVTSAGKKGLGRNPVGPSAANKATSAPC